MNPFREAKDNWDHYETPRRIAAYLIDHPNSLKSALVRIWPQDVPCAYGLEVTVGLTTPRELPLHVWVSLEGLSKRGRVAVALMRPDENKVEGPELYLWFDPQDTEGIQCAIRAAWGICLDERP